MLPLLATATFAQDLVITGACPGPMDATLTGLTPGGSFALVTGAPGGTTAVPAGACAGVALDVGNAALRLLGAADAAGEALASANVPAGLCAQDAQVLDLTTCAASPAVPIAGNACVLPSVPVASLGPSGPRMPDPAYMGVTSRGILDGGVRHDFAYLGPNGVAADQSATLVFRFFDLGGLEVCNVTYDASDAVVDNVIAYDYDGNVHQVQSAQTLALRGGRSTCDPVNPQVWGSDDLRDYVEGFGDWSFAVAPITASFAQDLEGWVTRSGGDWANDWAPYVLAESVGFGGRVWESSYAWSVQQTCEEVRVEQGGGFVDVVAPVFPLDTFYHSYEWSLFVL